MQSTMKFLIIAFAIGLSLVSCQEKDENNNGNNERSNDNNSIRMKIYRAYMKVQNKTWLDEELPKRLEYYWNRRQKILQSIKDFDEGKSTSAMAENQFTDMSDEERTEYLSNMMANKDEFEEQEGEETREDELPSSGIDTPQGNLPKSFDWREKKNCFHDAIDQGRCGSCYATAIRAVLESIRCIKNGISPQLSHQQMVECAGQYGYQVNGCRGGSPWDTLRYLQNEGSKLALNKAYPHSDRQNRCKVRQLNNTDFIQASPTNKKKLEFKIYRGESSYIKPLVEIGPLVFYIEATDSFMDYGKGVFRGKDCTDRFRNINHNVVPMGYGTQNGVDYWLLKNSWGPDWGENGYIKLERGRGACGIGERAYAVVS